MGILMPTKEVEGKGMEATRMSRVADMGMGVMPSRAILVDMMLVSHFSILTDWSVYTRVSWFLGDGHYHLWVLYRVARRRE